MPGFSGGSDGSLAFDVVADPVTDVVTLPAGALNVAVLDESTFERATTDANALQGLQEPVKGLSLDLGAYAVARCEIG
jgi:hypothetical protein